MPYYDKIDVPERIDINKTSASKKCGICHYWYFLDKGFKFQRNVCNGYHDVSVISINFNGIVILKIRDVDYRCTINGINKNDDVNVLQNIDLAKRSFIKMKRF